MLLSDEIEKNVAWLHDCVVHELIYDMSTPNARTLVMTLDCPEDLSRSEWDGKTLRLTATEVYLVRFTGLGHVLGEEILDAWRPGVSDTTKLELERGREVGLTVPPLAFTVSFHSG